MNHTTRGGMVHYIGHSELSLAGHPRNLEVLLSLFQPEGVDYVHHITASTPGFENLTTSLSLILEATPSGIQFFKRSYKITRPPQS